jgi:hypothetical protein
VQNVIDGCLLTRKRQPVALTKKNLKQDQTPCDMLSKTTQAFVYLKKGHTKG